MQDEGAAIMGLGHTLMEHYIFDETGRIRNLGAIDYRIPTSMDLPARAAQRDVENGDGPGPYGSKGMSEGALLCVAPAVAAAVRDATGVVDPRPAAHAGARLAGAAGARRTTQPAGGWRDDHAAPRSARSAGCRRSRS